MATASAQETIQVQRTITDLNTFEEVTVRKEGPFSPVADWQGFLLRIGNDTAKAVKLLNDALRAEDRRSLGDTAGGWLVVDPETNKTSDTAFDGVQGDNMKVNAFVLNMAKTVFGYSKDLDADAKAACKAKAIEMIKATPVIFDGLKKNCAVTE